MLQRRIVLIVILYWLIPICHAKDFSIETLIEGVNHSRLTIRSGEVVIMTTVERSIQKSENEIVTWIKAMKEQELKNFFPDDFFPKVSVKSFEKDYLIPHLEFVEARYRQNTEIEKLITAFQILHTDEDNSRVVRRYKQTHQEMVGVSIESENAKHSSDSNFYQLVYDGQNQMKENIGDIISSVANNDAFSRRFWNSDYHAGYILFELFGRAPYPISAHAKQVGKEQIAGTECYILTYEAANGIHAKIWIDPSLDFCIRKKEVSRKTEGSVRLISRTAYQQFEEFGDIWYPKIRDTTIYHKDGKTKTSAVVEVTSAKFNVDFPDDFFEVDRSLFDMHQGKLENKKDNPALGESSITPSTEYDESFLLCGPLSLFRVCELLNVQTHIDELQKLSSFAPDRGTTMLGLKEAATYKGLVPIGVKVPMELFRRKNIPMPAIAYVNLNHFIVFESVSKKGVTIFNPAGKYESPLTYGELSRIWNGDLLLFNRENNRRMKQEPLPMAFIKKPEYNFGKVQGIALK